MEDRVLRRREIERMVSLTERQIRSLENEDKFPRRFVISPGGRAVGWSFLEVSAWIEERVKTREQSSKPSMIKPGQKLGQHGRR